MSVEARYKLAMLLGTVGLVLIVLGLGMPEESGRTSDHPVPELNVLWGDDGEPVKHVDLSRLDPVMDEATATRLFVGVRNGKRQQYDPYAMAVLKPDTELSYPWPEHEGGRVAIATNNMGFRRDTPTAREKSGVRILVGGDSHTDGLVENADNFVNLLEAELNARGDGQHYECLNAGVGATGPHNYMGTLRTHLDLQPDVYVAVLYVGNDFTDAMFLSDQFTGRRVSKPDWEVYGAPLEAAMTRWNTSLVGNAFNQAYRFKAKPEEEWLALAEVATVFEEIAALCEQAGIVFLVAVLPTKLDVDDDDPQTVAEVMAALDLDAQDLEVNVRLRTSVIASMRSRGLAVLDLLPALRAAPGPHYWRKDHHLNVRGNSVVAEALFEALGPLLPTDG